MLSEVEPLATVICRFFSLTIRLSHQFSQLGTCHGPCNTGAGSRLAMIAKHIIYSFKMTDNPVFLESTIHPSNFANMYSIYFWRQLATVGECAG